MAEIFVSYKSEDRPRAALVAATLAAEGFSVWWDPDLHPGDTYDAVIERELHAAAAVLVLWSPLAVQSEWVRSEAIWAKGKGRLVPATIATCEPPLMFSLMQSARLERWRGDRSDPQWRKLVAALEQRMGRRATPLGPPPSEVDQPARSPNPADNRPLGHPTARMVTPVVGVVAAVLLLSGGLWLARAGPSVRDGDPRSISGTPAGFVRIEPGTFTMGSPATEAGRGSDETQHRVTISRPFWLATTEVSQGEYEELMGTNPARDPDCDNHDGVSLVDAAYPVICVSWVDAATYANARSKKEGLTPAYTIGILGAVTWNRSANGYRLPTEAEWEYAARAGRTTPWGGPTASAADLCDLGNVRDATAKAKWPTGTAADCTDGVLGPARVGSTQFASNAWGLRDMVGNVSEWTWDSFNFNMTLADATDPQCDEGLAKIYRGGGWRGGPAANRVAYRGWIGVGASEHGFRLARSIP